MGAKRQLILRVIEEDGPIDINVVAEETGMRKLTVYAIVPQLVDDGRVARDGDELRPQ